MIQLLINKLFFFLFVFSLIFVILLYNLIGFQYTDEICAVLLFVLFFYAVLKTPNWQFNKVFLFTLGVFLFYTIYSILIASNSKRAIFNDLIIQIKPYLGFFCVYQLKPYFDDSRKKLLKDISLLVWLLVLLPVGIISIVNDRFMALIMDHPTYFAIATIIVSLCYLYCCDFKARDILIFFIMLSVGLVSGKSKFYGFFILPFFLFFFFNNIRKFKFNFTNISLICGMFATIFLVAWKKISLYFYQVLSGSGNIDEDMVARFVLYRTSPEVLIDYFPFGSGLASFATHSSGAYYSDIYMKYGIENVWGISKQYTNFISDTYYPSLAQFGIIGIILFILFWVYIIGKAIRLYQKSGYTQTKHIVIILLIIGFLAIESTTGSTFIAQGGLFTMMMSGMILSDMQKENYVF
jgi:hypothetical protein